LSLSLAFNRSNKGWCAHVEALLSSKINYIVDLFIFDKYQHPDDLLEARWIALFCLFFGC
jgi:hypothetical protein